MITLTDKRAKYTNQAFPVKMLDMDITEICPLACHYCTAPEAPVLMADLSYREIQDIQVGDRVIGFSRELGSTGKMSRSYLQEATVLAVHTREAPLAEIAFTNHPPIRATPTHLWWSGNRWHSLRPGRKVSRVTEIFPSREIDDDFKRGYLCGLARGDGTYRVSNGRDCLRLAFHDFELIERVREFSRDLGVDRWRPLDVKSWASKTEAIYTQDEVLLDLCWRVEKSPSLSYMRGWLAGFYDAERTLGRQKTNVTLKLSQKPGKILDIACRFLEALSIPYKLARYSGVAVSVIEVTGKEHILSFLTQCPPVLERKRDVTGTSVYKKRAEVQSVRVVEPKATVYTLTTTTGNYIAWGLLSKNCYKNKMVGRRMDLHLAEEAVDAIFYGNPEPGHRQIHFFGGEPLAAWGVIKHVVNYARAQLHELGPDYSFSWGCTSSIVLLDDEKVEFFKSTGGSIHVSIDGTPAAHDKTRKFHNGKGSSEEVTAKVPLALAITPGDVARATVPADNAHLLFDSITYIRSLGFTGCAPVPVFEDDWTPDFWMELDEQLRQATDWWCSLVEAGDAFYLKYISDSIRAIITPVKREKPCGAGRSLLAVDMEGTVSPCHRFAGSLKKAKQMGKVGERLNLDMIRAFQDFDATKHDWPECQTCEAYYACSGGCPHVNFEYWGRIDRKHPNYCKFTQMAYRHGKYAFERISRSAPELTRHLFGTTVPGRNPRR